MGIVILMRKKVHYHYTQPFKNANYDNTFSICDRIFKTFAFVEKTDKLIYGIDTHMDVKESSTLGNLLASPFKKYEPPVGSKFG